jgi:RimJ/RimL family protein N-acetyltransferase
VAACNDPVASRFLPLLPSPYRLSDAIAFRTELVPATWSVGGASYAIADPATDRLLGAVGLTRLPAQHGEIGYWVAPWARRRGVATAATVALSGWAFGQGFQRLELRTEEVNVASQRVALACGFTRESVLRGFSVARDGTPRDMIGWARLAGDPPGPTPRPLPDLPGGELSDGVVRLRPTDWSGSLWLAGLRAAMTVRGTDGDDPAGDITLDRLDPTVGAVSYRLDPQRLDQQRFDQQRFDQQWLGRAVALVAAWAFGAVGLVRLEVGAAPDDPATHRALEAVGFRREGCRRARLSGPDGTRTDDVLYALLPADLRPADHASRLITP